MSVDDGASGILAAGAVLWRRGKTGEPEIAVVHRPRYDDWSLPKGKLDPGETVPQAAAREVFEETGFRVVLGRELKTVRYEVPGRRGTGVPKTVYYFGAEATGGAFEPNHEVDELRWVSPAEAENLFTRPADAEVLRSFLEFPSDLHTVLLARHAKAGSREDWNGDDDLRPLAAAGFRQAEALRAMARLFAPERVFSAPRLRCVQTVQGIAEDIGAEVGYEPLFSEEGYWTDPVRGVVRLLDIAAGTGTPVISSQGGVIPDLIAALADRDGVSLPVGKGGKVPAKKGSLWVLSFLPGNGAEGPKLVAADYFPTPLPTPAPAGS